jgi:hypothetical protein
MWEGYRTVVELAEETGWVAHPFDENWDEGWYPSRFLQPMITAFFELYPEPPEVGYGYCVIMVSDLGDFKLDTLPLPELRIRMTGPLTPEIMAGVRDQYAHLIVEMEVLPAAAIH